MKKILVFLLVAAMLLSTSAFATAYAGSMFSTPASESLEQFQAGCSTLIEYLEEMLEDGHGVDLGFSNDRIVSQANYEGLQFSPYSGRGGDVYCVMQGHDAAMDVYRCETDNRAEYENVVLTALYTVQWALGECEQDLVDWAFERIDTITSSGGNIAMMYPLVDSTYSNMFFYMETDPDTMYPYKAVVSFACEDECVLTEAVEEMKSKAGGKTAQKDEQIIVTPGNGGNCQDCDGTGSVPGRIACSACGGFGKASTCSSCGGSPLCRVCDGSGSVEQYDYILKDYSSRMCSACGGFGACRACRGSGFAECTYCFGLGEVPGWVNCSSCGGDGQR